MTCLASQYRGKLLSLYKSTAVTADEHGSLHSTASQRATTRSVFRGCSCPIFICLPLRVQEVQCYKTQKQLLRPPFHLHLLSPNLSIEDRFNLFTGVSAFARNKSNRGAGLANLLPLDAIQMESSLEYKPEESHLPCGHCRRYCCKKDDKTLSL